MGGGARQTMPSCVRAAAYRKKPGVSARLQKSGEGTYVFVRELYECISPRFTLQGPGLVEEEVELGYLAEFRESLQQSVSGDTMTS